MNKKYCSLYHPLSSSFAAIFQSYNLNLNPSIIIYIF